MNHNPDLNTGSFNKNSKTLFSCCHNYLQSRTNRGSINAHVVEKMLDLDLPGVLTFLDTGSTPCLAKHDSLREEKIIQYFKVLRK